MLTKRSVSALVAGVGVTGLSYGLGAQSSQTPTFDAASIRPVAAASPLQLSQLMRIERGRLIGQASLLNMVRIAYDVEPYETVLAADRGFYSLLEERFEVAARAPASVPEPGPEDVRAMMRKMLAERFLLEVRIDSEVTRATALRVIQPGSLGAGLRPAPDGCRVLPPGARLGNPKFAESYVRNCSLTYFDSRIRGTATIGAFAKFLSVMSQQPIVDRTGLTGMFAIDVAVASASLTQNSTRLGTAKPSDGPAFVDGLRAQMGLATRSEQLPVRKIVVAKVEPLVEN